MTYSVNWDTLDLGKRTDSAIAKEIGCTRAAVQLQRKQRGIGACNPHHSHVLVTDYVLAHVGYHVPKTFTDIYDDVLNDYGTVSEMTVRRVLARLVSCGLVEVRPVYDIESMACGYVRVQCHASPRTLNL